MEEEIKNNPNNNPEKEADNSKESAKERKNNICYNCKYFRLYSAKLTDQSKKFDGYCSKRSKAKLKNNTCKCFTNKD